MFTVLTVIRKKSGVTTQEFRRFMKDSYGRTYQEMPQTRSYVQYFLADLATDDAEDPIDAIVEIGFDSEAKMREALEVDSYHQAAKAREEFMRETSVGIHSALVEETNRLV
jgi:methylphosphotriester-DNA--protein-cysteine methyltransferase